MQNGYIVVGYITVVLRKRNAQTFLIKANGHKNLICINQEEDINAYGILCRPHNNVLKHELWHIMTTVSWNMMPWLIDWLRTNQNVHCHWNITSFVWINIHKCFHTNCSFLPGAGEYDAFVVRRPLQLSPQHVAVDKVERDHRHLQNVNVSAKYKSDSIHFILIKMVCFSVLTY